MKKMFKIALMGLILLNQPMLVVAMDQVSKLENLNVLIFEPTTYPIVNDNNMLTIDQVCTAIQNGHNTENNGKFIEIKGALFKLSTQIPSDYKENICIYASGYAGMSGNARYKYAGAGAYSTYNNLKAGLIPKNAICISFDGQVNDRAYFNFGQELDQACLNTVYEETIKRNPQATLFLSGSCKGATTILNYLTNPKNKNKDNNFSHIKAIFLESPSISLERVTQQVANNYLYGFVRPLSYLFKAAFPNYKWNQKNMLDYAQNLPDHIPILIGYFRQDKVANYEDIITIGKRFKEAGKNIELFESENKELTHGHLAQAEDFQRKLKIFLGKNIKPSLVLTALSKALFRKKRQHISESLPAHTVFVL